MYSAKHARLAALALGACLTVACGDRAENATTDTAAGAVANAPVTGGAGTGSMEATNDVPRNDAEIVTVAAGSNAAEISSSQLAQEKAQHAEVKQFATMLSKDHTAMQQQMEKLNIQPASSDMSRDMQDNTEEKLNDMKGKSGADFDKAFIDFQVEAHQKTIERLTNAQSNAQNAELKTMLAAAMPKLQAHLQKAQQLQQQLSQR